MVMLVASTEAAYNRFTPAFEEFAKTLSYKNARPGIPPAAVHPTRREISMPANPYRLYRAGHKSIWIFTHRLSFATLAWILMRGEEFAKTFRAARM